MECLAQAGDGGIEVVVEINKNVISPEALPQFFPGDHLPRILDQQQQNLEGLLTEADFDTALGEPTSPHIDFEAVKPKN
jgi:hypothetical protein